MPLDPALSAALMESVYSTVQLQQVGVEREMTGLLLPHLSHQLKCPGNLYTNCKSTWCEVSFGPFCNHLQPPDCDNLVVLPCLLQLSIPRGGGLLLKGLAFLPVCLICVGRRVCRCCLLSSCRRNGTSCRHRSTSTS